MNTTPIIALLLVAAATGLGPTAVATPPSTAIPVDVVRSDMGGALVVPLSGPDAGAFRWLGGASPQAFGRRDGHLRVLAMSPQRHEVIVGVDGRDDGGLYAVGLDDAPPRFICAASRLDLDLALSPDGQRLAYVAQGVLTVADLRPGATPPCRALATPVEGERLDRPRWWDAATLLFEREGRVGGRVVADIARVPADGSAAPTLLLPGKAKPSQDRAQLGLPDGRVLMYSDGIPSVGSVHGVVRLADRHGAYLHGRVRGGTLATLGGGGTDRTVTLAVIGDDGAIRRIGGDTPIWLDPIATPDGAAAVWTRKGADGYRVERVPVDGSAPHTLTEASPRPIQLVTWGPKGETVYGCHGDEEIVAIGPSGGVRAVTTVTGAPSCPLRAVVAGERGPVVVYYAQDGRDLRPAWLPVGERRPRMMPAGTSIEGVLDGRVLLHVGAASKIVATEPGGRERTLVPWRPSALPEVWRSGGVVAWREERGPIRAVDVAGGPPREVVAAPEGLHILGPADGHLVAFDDGARRIISFRLDGKDAEKPRVVLADIAGWFWLSAPSGRVVALRRLPNAAGHLRSLSVSVRVDGSEASAPRRLLPEDALLEAVTYDRFHDQVVALDAAHGRLLAAKLDGSEHDAPRTLPLNQAAPTHSADFAAFARCGFSELEPIEAGVLMVYRRMDMNMPALCRQVLVPWSGGAAQPWVGPSDATVGPPAPRASGGETRHPLR